ncbi:hypothetical protein EGW08_011956 [Elysia chlorotica]|uniref:RING-type domain-containing protein n=1 Tax=Elysia chlorotica TaxID=188477 RepID=A0A433TFC4_ELYCH|nr:hypothetical protein EGW08_011956 [Elysia chlorotica]
MAPLHPHRGSGKSGQQSSKAHTSSEHRSPLSKTNSEHSQGVNSHKKTSKRRLQDTYSSNLSDGKGSGTTCSHKGSEERGPDLTSVSATPGPSSSRQSDSTWKFRAQSTQNEIETDGLCTSNTGAIYNDQWPKNGALANAPNSEKSMNTGKDCYRMLDSTYVPNEHERKVIEIASYVINISPEDVKRCLLHLKNQGKPITNETVVDECLKRRSELTSTLAPQNFPQHSSISTSNGTPGLLSTPPSHPGSTAASEKSPTRIVPGASQSQHQQNSSVRNGAASEDQVDITSLPSEQHSNTKNTNSIKKVNNPPSVKNSTIKANNPSSVYHSRLNNVSSRSSARDVSSLSESSSTGTAGNPTAGSDALDGPSQGATRSDNRGSDGAKLSNNTSTTSTTVADCGTALTSEVQNNLGSDHSQDGQSETLLSPRPSLREVDPAKYLEICLRLVKEENHRLDSARHCGQCLSKARDITFLPCGHVWACRACAGPLYVCPCCNKNIIATVDTYLC